MSNDTAKITFFFFSIFQLMCSVLINHVTANLTISRFLPPFLSAKVRSLMWNQVN